MNKEKGSSTIAFIALIAIALMVGIWIGAEKDSIMTELDFNTGIKSLMTKKADHTAMEMMEKSAEGAMEMMEKAGEGVMEKTDEVAADAMDKMEEGVDAMMKK